MGVIDKHPDFGDFLLANDLLFLANPVSETSDVKPSVTCSAADRPMSARVVAKPLRRRRRRRNASSCRRVAQCLLASHT